MKLAAVFILVASTAQATSYYPSGAAVPTATDPAPSTTVTGLVQIRNVDSTTTFGANVWLRNNVTLTATIMDVSVKNPVAVTNAGLASGTTYKVDVGQVPNITLSSSVYDVNVRSSTSNLINEATTLTATVTGGAGGAVTLVLPAVAGKYHYIHEVHFHLFATANRTAGAAPIFLSTTNLNNLSYAFDAGATAKGEFAGSMEESAIWMRSAAANTDTSIICPAVTDCIWIGYVHYEASP